MPDGGKYLRARVWMPAEELLQQEGGSDEVMDAGARRLMAAVAQDPRFDIRPGCTYEFVLLVRELQSPSQETA